MRVTIVRKKTRTQTRHTFRALDVTKSKCLEERSIQGKSNHVAILRQPCRYYLKGTCTRTPCEYWHPPEFQIYKHKRVAKPGISVCSRFKMLMNNHAKKKAKERLLFSQKKRKRRQECRGYCEICTTIGLCITRIGSTRVSRNEIVSVKPDAKSLGTDSKNTIHSVYATSSKYPGKERTIAWKIQVKNPHQRSHYSMKFEDRSHEETERQQRCARSKAWNLVNNIYKPKEKDKATCYSPA